eukprot:SAG22_NODE_789_length_7224_cov_2.663953_3_plen_110_part_00
MLPQVNLLVVGADGDHVLRGDPVRQRSSLSKGSDHCLSFCFSAFPCGSTALTSDRCNQLPIPEVKCLSGTDDAHWLAFIEVGQYISWSAAEAMAARYAGASGSSLAVIR